MAIPLINQRYNIAYKYFRNEMYKVHRAAWNEEDLTGTTSKLPFVMFVQMCLTYCTMIYNDLTLPNKEVGAETWKEVKTRFDFDDHVKYFSSQGINLQKVAGFYDLESLAVTNRDWQYLIDQQPSNDEPTYP